MQSARIEPTKTKLLKDYKHNSPLIGCRFDPSGRFVFASAQDKSSAQNGSNSSECVGPRCCSR